MRLSGRIRWTGESEKAQEGYEFLGKLGSRRRETPKEGKPMRVAVSKQV
jgi:hypothetical protein